MTNRAILASVVLAAYRPWAAIESTSSHLSVAARAVSLCAQRGHEASRPHTVAWILRITVRQLPLESRIGAHRLASGTKAHRIGWGPMIPIGLVALSLFCMVLHLPYLHLFFLPGCEEGARSSASVLHACGVRNA